MAKRATKPDTWTLLLALFKTEVHDRAAGIDPDEEHDWHSLTIGWALAKGLPPKEATEFATHVRYKTDLG